MTATTAPKVRSATASSYEVSLDAFLYGSATFLVLLSLEEVGSILLPRVAAPELPGWVQLVGPLTMVGSFAVGALGALLVHDRSVRRGRTWLGMLLGLVGGVAVLAVGFLTLRLLRSPLPDESGPWALVIAVVVAVLAFVLPGLVSAVRDLLGRRVQPRVDWLRLAATAVSLAIVVWSLVIGGETAEAGLFAVLFAGGPAAFAALGGAIAVREKPATPS